MLIENQVKCWIAICYLRGFRFWSHQVLDMLLYKQRAAKDPHHFVDVSINIHFVFDYGDSAVSADGRVDLNPYRCLGVAPKGSDSQVLFYPLKEKFHLPSVLIQTDNLVGCKIEIVGVEDKRPIQIGYIGGYASEFGRIIFCISTTDKSNCVVLKYITPFRHIKSVINDKFRLGFFADYEECTQLINLMKATQIPISLIEYVTGGRFIINHIHGVNIMNGCIGYINHYRYLRNDIQLCMELDSGFGASKLSPVIDAQAEVNGGGIKCIELTSDSELFIDSGALSLRYHVVGEFLEHSPIAISIASGQDIAVNCPFPEPKMKTLLPMGSRNVCQFPETFAAEQLTKHENEQLTPVRQLPSESSVFNLMFDSVLHDSFKFAFWQKAGNLTKNISTCIHGNRDLGLGPNITISKVRQGFYSAKFAA